MRRGTIDEMTEPKLQSSYSLIGLCTRVIWSPSDSLLELSRLLNSLALWSVPLWTAHLCLSSTISFCRSEPLRASQ